MIRSVDETKMESYTDVELIAQMVEFMISHVEVSGILKQYISSLSAIGHIWTSFIDNVG